MSNFKITTSFYFVIFFFILIFVAIFAKEFIFDFIITQTGGDQIEQSEKATKVTADLLLSLDKITLNTTILNSPYLQSLTQLPTYPIDTQTLSNFGKTNPFLGSFIVVPTAATSSVGGVVYSNQRSVNNNNSIRAISTKRAR